MKEIMLPVHVIDDDCRTCEELDIVSDVQRLYAGSECVAQDIHLMCSNMNKCTKIRKRLEEKAKGNNHV